MSADWPRRERARALAAGRPFISADLATVTWLTGLVTDIEYGPSPFTVPPLVVLAPDGAVLAVASEDEAPGVAEGVESLTFPGFAVEDVDRTGALVALVLEALVGAKEIAADLTSLPGSLVAALDDQGARLVEIGPAVRAARAVKDPDELECIRSATRIADVGQATAREASSTGSSELDVWALVRAAMEREAGGRVPILADLVSGERTAEVGGPAGSRVLRENDLVLVDLVPRLHGYWADSCATIAVGEAQASARRFHQAAVGALERAVGLCRPGRLAGEVDAAAREAVEEAGGSYPHHTGHGLGTSFHEEPRIIPGSERVLEPGMVVALEPGSYGDGVGVRVERVVVVTDGEPELLSGHDIAL